MTFFTESGRQHNESTCIFVLSQKLNRIRSIFCCNGKDGQVHIRQVFGITVTFDPLHFILFGIHYIKFAIKTSIQKIFQDFTTWFLNIV